MNSETRGIVLDIQRSALHDGPGVRTTVFLKGCPLRCLWCHNPESWKTDPECAVPSCQDEEPKIYGRSMTVREVMDEVRKDLVYYDISGGGLTLSGGEPTLQFKFCAALLRAAHSEGIHTCLDTCGFGPAERFLELLPDVDLFLWDYKATGRDRHKALTGVNPDTIAGNFQLLYERGARIILRCPMVPGINDDNAHLEAIAGFARDFPNLAGIELLPYHNWGADKYVKLALPRPALAANPPDEELLRKWRCYFKKTGCANVVVT